MSGSGEKVDRLRWISQFVFAVGLLLPILWAYSGIGAYQADDSDLARRCGTPIIIRDRLSRPFESRAFRK
jgi:hypothetical protein